jgi:hypothetical protein
VMLPIMRTSCIPPSTIWREKEVNKSSIDSQKPTTYIAHATALANEKINPMDPPNSGPRDLDIIKYVPPPVTEIENQHRHRKKAVKNPPLMIPFVLIALIDSAVIEVTRVVVQIKMRAW